MKILLVIRPENKKESNELYINSITRFGGEVILVNDEDSWDSVSEKLEHVDGILLPGGDDVGKLDFLLIDYALNKNLKLLGICQGMQSMALFGSNDSLISIGDDRHYLKDRYCHKVELEKDSFLYNLFGINSFDVNSYHYQTVANSYKFFITGRSSDGLIEVVEGNSKVFQVGVQWHPERMLDYDENSFKLISEFVTK